MFDGIAADSCLMNKVNWVGCSQTGNHAVERVHRIL